VSIFPPAVVIATTKLFRAVGGSRREGFVEFVSAFVCRRRGPRVEFVGYDQRGRETVSLHSVCGERTVNAAGCFVFERIAVGSNHAKQRWVSHYLVTRFTEDDTSLLTVGGGGVDLCAFLTVYEVFSGQAKYRGATLPFFRGSPTSARRYLRSPVVGSVSRMRSTSQRRQSVNTNGSASL